jgi:hypothetical protein
MADLQSFVRCDIRSQTRIPGGVEEVVRDGEERFTVEGKHSRIIREVNRRRRGFGVSGRAGV